MYSRNVEIAGHVLALKTMSIAVYPTYAEYVNFCLGFMIVDLPWLNNILPEVFASPFDNAPTGYFFYFTNMNFAAMHFFTFLLFVILFVAAFFCFSQHQDNKDSSEGNESSNLSGSKNKNKDEYL